MGTEEKHSSAHLFLVMCQLSRTWSIEGLSFSAWSHRTSRYSLILCVKCIICTDSASMRRTHKKNNTYTHKYSTQSTWAGDLRTHLLGIGRQCMCVSVLDGERERDTSPSGLHMNHVYYIRQRER